MAPAAHHRLLIKELEDIEAGRNDRLLVSMPPGSAKSTYASKLFPAWFLARKPNRSVIGASHTSTLAEDFSRDVQSFIRENEQTLGYRLITEPAELWKTSNGGRYRAAGVGGPITGSRADCLRGDTVLVTPSGEVTLLEVAGRESRTLVLSYDLHNRAIGYREVIASRQQKAPTYCRVRTVSGRLVEATPDHPFFTGRGWVKADELAAGDVLLCAVRRSEREAGLSDREISGFGFAEPVLQQHVFEASRGHGPGLRRTLLPQLQQQTAGRHAKVSDNLLGHVQKGALRPREWPSPEAAWREAVCLLQPDICSEIEGRNGDLLLAGVQGQGARSGDDGVSQSRLAQRSESASDAATLFASLQEDEAFDHAARRVLLRGLRLDKEAACSSYRHECVGQSLVESGDSLRAVPQPMACCGAIEAERDSVALVERVCEPTEVFDIQVSGSACFFANGVLVHNCAIIDDPVKSREQADSPAQRERVWKWFMADLRTRLRPGAAIVVIMTRWSEDDLGGRILTMQPDRWKTLILPAFATEDDPLGRQPGEPLWSDDAYGYGGELSATLHEYRQTGGMRDWYALYQQTPRPDEGSLFKATQVAVLPTPPALHGAVVARAWDLAATKKIGTRDPDWTAGVKMARMRDGRLIVLDVVRLRGGPEEVERAIVNTATQDGSGVQIGLPQDPGQAGKSQILHLSRQLMGYRIKSSPETGSKETRAAAYAAQVNVGNVSVVQAPWNRPYLDELASFPGSKDDQVDASSRCFDLVAVPTYDTSLSWVGDDLY